MPIYNAAPTLAEQLAALAEQDYRGEWELLAADNGSTDDSLHILETWRDRFPSLQVVDASDLRGVSHARNVGARVAAGELIALCDADDIAEPGWLRELADASLDFDLVGGRLEEESLNPPGTSLIRPPVQDTKLPVALGFLPYAVGANFAVRREVVLALGGWREDYREGADDVDFCWRAELAGYRLGFAAKAVMRYRHRSDLRGFARQVYRYGFMEPQLFRHYRSHSLSRSSTWRAVRNWLWLALHLPDLWGSGPRKAVWLRKAAHRWGRLRGSLHFWTLFL